MLVKSKKSQSDYEGSEYETVCSSFDQISPAAAKHKVTESSANLATELKWVAKFSRSLMHAE